MCSATFFPSRFHQTNFISTRKTRKTPKEFHKVVTPINFTKCRRRKIAGRTAWQKQQQIRTPTPNSLHASLDMHCSCCWKSNFPNYRSTLIEENCGCWTFFSFSTTQFLFPIFPFVRCGWGWDGECANPISKLDIDSKNNFHPNGIPVLKKGWNSNENNMGEKHWESRACVNATRFARVFVCINENEIVVV